jgi:protein gp37
MARRLKAMHQTKYTNGFSVTLHHNSLLEPLSWRKASNIFVCSMGDLFHENVPFDFIDQVMATIVKTPKHRYQILTKRAERMAEYFTTRSIPQNVWLGVTVEAQDTIYRIDFLRGLNATVKFLSCEPLLEDLGEVDLSGIDWVIVGGESGPQARAMQKSWVLNLMRQVYEYDGKFFFKQWGTWGADGIKRSKHANGKMLDGKVIQEMPLR